ncbi:MAG: hypothetical protein U0802_06510 [Candidatus Binatia bacterium]
MPVTSLTVLAATLGLCAGAAMVALGDPERAAQWRVAHRWYCSASARCCRARRPGAA